MINDINKVSPKIRDNSLNRNIGKYSQIKEMLSTPIGEFVDIYNSTSDYLSSKSPNGLLYYTNDKLFLDKKGDLEESFEPKFFKYRDNNPINIDYSNDAEQKYYYADGMGYNDATTNTEISNIVKSVVGLAYGDGVNLDFSGGNVSIDSASLETATSLANRIVEETTYNKTTLGTIGLKKLSNTWANAAIQHSSNKIARNLFYKDKLNYERDYAQIDTDILELVRAQNSKVIRNILPMYFYKKVRENNLQLDTDVSKGKTWVNDSEEMEEYLTDEKLIKFDSKGNEIGNNLSIKELRFNKDSLLYKTSQMFRSGKIETLITNTNHKIDGDKHISKGRGLERKGKPNDFFRAWTAINQYNRVSSLIRPLDDENYNILKENLKRVRPNGDNFTNNTVLQRDGFVKIAPYKSDITDPSDPKIDNKKYMFSIENLAWKDHIDSIISGTSQEGPNGGRIMWFPPYDISINESSNVNWNSDSFIGRGEPVRTYVDTERSATLSFTMIVDHPSIINYYKQAKTSQTIEEDDYLRMFAGEDIINLGTKTNEEKSGEEKPEVTEPISEGKLKTLSFKVYFPNNLSGIDYINNTSEIMKYLYEGGGINVSDSGRSGYERDGCLDDGSESKNGEFYYIVDKKYENQTLVNSENYKSTGTDNLNQNSDGSAENQRSFEKIYEALTTGDDYEINDIIKNAKTIDIVGSSSKQGVEEYNIELSSNRAKVVSGWLKTFNKEASVSIINAYNTNTEKAFEILSGTTHIATLRSNAKYVEGVLTHSVTSITTGANLVDKSFTLTADTVGYAVSLDKSKSNYIGKVFSRGYNKNADLYLEELHENVLSDIADDAVIEIKAVTGDTDANSIINKRDRFVKVVLTLDPNGVDIEKIINNEGYSIITTEKDSVKDSASSSTARRVNKSMYGSYHDRNYPKDNKIKRYNDESEFFESIGVNDRNKNIIMNKFSEKIKYFHPAFHSSTPEGFNSRLTFLHQCTRQGPTSELSSTNNTKNSATNMAFGRPPICILRLGDFYNTKITINSLTISYDPLVWDLNEEGVGVQPMLAKITLGFNFIGGSDLTGDIARLQNAVTFNYFANTGVYDDRNDSITSDIKDGTKEYRTLYNPGVYDSKE